MAATAITTAAATRATIELPLDQDWFRFQLAAQGTADDFFSLLQIVADPRDVFRLDILDQSLNTVRSVAVKDIAISADRSAKVSLDGLSAGTYFARVRLENLDNPAAATGTGRYDLFPDIGAAVVEQARAAGHQVVFGMDLKKADVGPVADDPLKMVGLQAHARACRQAVHGLFSKGEAVRQWWL